MKRSASTRRPSPGSVAYAKTVLAVEQDEVATTPVPLEAVQLREAIRSVHHGFVTDVQLAMRADQIFDSRRERVIHAYGKGFRDLFRLRRGMAGGAPDLVIYPESENEICSILRAAAERDVKVIPFGGGSNISGCLERVEPRRMTVSLDMRRMRRVLEVDAQSARRASKLESSVPISRNN